METTLFILSFVKTLAFLAIIWFVLTLVAYTWNRTGGSDHLKSLAAATDFVFFAPFFVAVGGAIGIIGLPEPSAAAAVPAETSAGSFLGFVAYFCLSYLAKKRFELPEKLEAAKK